MSAASDRSEILLVDEFSIAVAWAWFELGRRRLNKFP
jgi:hypothetical protein